MTRIEQVGRPVEFLLAEDNPGDVRLTREALKDSKIRNNLNVLGNGISALNHLRREPPYENALRPDIMLLDRNLPKMDGREVLSRIKADPALKRTPVVVITSSEAEQDILRTYDCYVTKPVDLDQFIKVVQSIDSFWRTIVQLPIPDEAEFSPRD